VAPEGNLINNIGSVGKASKSPTRLKAIFFFQEEALSAHNITEGIRNRAVALWKGKMKM